MKPGFPTDWTPPAHWTRIKTLDMHTGGEPLRVILDGFPEPEATTILGARREMHAQHDHLRKALMWEPRGHADMYGLLPLPPERPDSDFGVLFLHNEGYSTMCGHATIAIARLAVELGWVPKQEPETCVTLDAPCGQLKAWVQVRDGAAGSVRFHCVPSFVVGLDRVLAVPVWGKVSYDLAYGGAFYAYVDSDALGIPLVPENYRQLIDAGMAIKRAVAAQDDAIRHPFEEDLSFLYGTIFIGGPVSEGVDSRNVCIFADGEVDRCPTGSGVSGRMAIHAARGELAAGASMTIESITGSRFRGSIVQHLEYGGLAAVIPEVEGSAYITGRHEFLIDPADPFAHGFFLR